MQTIIVSTKEDQGSGLAGLNDDVLRWEQGPELVERGRPHKVACWHWFVLGKVFEYEHKGLGKERVQLSEILAERWGTVFKYVIQRRRWENSRDAKRVVLVPLRLGTPDRWKHLWKEVTNARKLILVFLLFLALLVG